MSRSSVRDRDIDPGADDSIGPGYFRQASDGRYYLEFEHWGVEFEVDRVRRKFEELFGELSVRCVHDRAKTIEGHALHTADFNFSSTRAHQERAKLLADRTPGLTFD